jgi:hypothetical protein
MSKRQEKIKNGERKRLVDSPSWSSDNLALLSRNRAASSETT